MRSKLSLNLEDLSVESFDTTIPQKAKGTVFGEQCTCYTNCTCPGCPTCDATCPNTCVNTCDDATCGASCDWSCDYSCQCNSNQPCPTALYSACNGLDCY